MTVAVANPIVSYVAAGVGPYSITFPFIALTDVKVVLISAAGTVTTPVFTATWTSVTLATAPIDGRVVIYRDTPNNQVLALSDLAAFPAEGVEAALDRLTLQNQEQGRDLTSAIRLPFGESANLLPSASERANKFLAFNAVGQPYAAITMTAGQIRVWDLDDYGAAGNGGWTSVGGLTGTDDGPLIQALSDQLEALGGGILRFGARVYRSNQGLVQPKGVTWFGCGTPHHAYFETGDSRKGTALLVNTPVGGWAYTSEGTIEGGTVMRDMAIYDAGTNALSGLCRIPGKLHTQIENVEYGCLGRDAGVGMFCEKQGGALTIYGTFINIRVLRAQHALDIEGDSNALVFMGCSFQGSRSSRRMRAEGGLQPRAVAFVNCSFERIYNQAAAAPEIRFVAAGSAERRQIVNYSGTSCYVTPFQQIAAAVSMSDYGCYYEDGGQTGANYNDGINGAWPLLSIVDVSNATDCQSISFNNSDWVNTYLRDNGTATQASAYRGGTDYNQVARPCASQRKTTLQAIPSAIWTRVSLQTNIDSARGQFEWEAGANQYRILAGGNYAISGQVFFETMGVADYVQCRIVAGAKIFTGHSKNGTAAKPTGCTITAFVTLARGDTIAMDAFQSSGASQDLQGYAENTWLSVVKL